MANDPFIEAGISIPEELPYHHPDKDGQDHHHHRHKSNSTSTI